MSIFLNMFYHIYIVKVIYKSPGIKLNYLTEQERHWGLCF